MCTNDNAFSHSSPLSSTVGGDVHTLFPHEINNGLSRPQITTLPHASGICLVSRVGSSQGAFFLGKFQLPVQNMHFYDCKNCLNGIIHFDVIRIVVPSDVDFHLFFFIFFYFMELQVCLPSIVQEFLRQAKAARLFNASVPSIYENSLESELSKAFGGTERLDMFFPFDPYLLKDSDRLVYLKPQKHPFNFKYTVVR